MAIVIRRIRHRWRRSQLLSPYQQSFLEQRTRAIEMPVVPEAAKYEQTAWRTPVALRESQDRQTLLPSAEPICRYRRHPSDFSASCFQGGNVTADALGTLAS